jgi:hypothetical protein
LQALMYGMCFEPHWVVGQLGVDTSLMPKLGRGDWDSNSTVALASILKQQMLLRLG